MTKPNSANDGYQAPMLVEVGKAIDILQRRPDGGAVDRVARRLVVASRPPRKRTKKTVKKTRTKK